MLFVWIEYSLLNSKDRKELGPRKEDAVYHVEMLYDRKLETLVWDSHFLLRGVEWSNIGIIDDIIIS